MCIVVAKATSVLLQSTTTLANTMAPQRVTSVASQLTTTSLVGGGGGGTGEEDWASIVWTNFIGGVIIWVGVVFLCLYCYKRACINFTEKCCDLFCCCISPKLRSSLLCCCEDDEVSASGNSPGNGQDNSASTCSTGDILAITLQPPPYDLALNMPKPSDDCRHTCERSRKITVTSSPDSLSSEDTGFTDDAGSVDSSVPVAAETSDSTSSSLIDEVVVNTTRDVQLTTGVYVGQQQEHVTVRTSAQVHRLTSSDVQTLCNESNSVSVPSQNVDHSPPHSPQHHQLPASESGLTVGTSDAQLQHVTCDTVSIISDMLPSYEQAMIMLQDEALE